MISKKEIPFQSLKSILPLRELLAFRLCNERFLIWPLTAVEPSGLRSWKNFSRSTCLAGGGGIVTVGLPVMASCFDSTGDGRLTISCCGSRVRGRMRGRWSISDGTECPINPNGLSIRWSPSSSGCRQAFPFLILYKSGDFLGLILIR